VLLLWRHQARGTIPCVCMCVGGGRGCLFVCPCVVVQTGVKESACMVIKWHVAHGYKVRA